MEYRRHLLSLHGRYGKTIINLKTERRRRNREAQIAVQALKHFVPAFAIRRKQHFA